jgi:hypothetical protein
MEILLQHCLEIQYLKLLNAFNKVSILLEFKVTLAYFSYV